MKKLKIIAGYKNLFLAIFLLIGFLPLQNMALCIDDKGHAEFEYLNNSTKKCSDFSLTKQINKNQNEESITSKLDHCGSCNDLDISADKNILKAVQFDFDIGALFVFDFDFLYSPKRNIKEDYHNSKKSFNLDSPTLLSIKSVKIIC